MPADGNKGGPMQLQKAGRWGGDRGPSPCKKFTQRSLE